MKLKQYCIKIIMMGLSVCLCVYGEALQTQTDSLERARLKLLRTLEDKWSTGVTLTQVQPN